MTRTLLLLALLAAPAAAQEGGDELARKLVERIQQDLAEVDRLLDSAATAEDLAPLQDARAAHVRAISDLEELIRQVKYRRGSSSSSGGGGGGSSASQQQQQPRGVDGRDQAGQAPAPQEQPGAQQGQEPQPADERGERLGEEAAAQATEAGRQVDGQQPPPQPVGDFLRRDTDARWGVLPPKLQERLMNLHVDDVPERYRAWLEAYVRELSRREAADGAR